MSVNIRVVNRPQQDFKPGDVLVQRDDNFGDLHYLVVDGPDHPYIVSLNSADGPWVVFETIDPNNTGLDFEFAGSAVVEAE